MRRFKFDELGMRELQEVGTEEEEERSHGELLKAGGGGRRMKGLKGIA